MLLLKNQYELTADIPAIDKMVSTINAINHIVVGFIIYYYMRLLIIISDGLTDKINNARHMRFNNVLVVRFHVRISI